MSVAEGTGHYLDTALQLAKEFAKTAIERDERGGTAKAERDLLRKSGLLSLIIPKSLGGLGKDWKAVLQITRELAKVDGSLAHLFGYHFLCLTSVHLFGSPQQKEKYYKETAENNLFWGNTYNPLDESLLVKREGDQLKLIGKKSFCSGAKDSERLLISAKSPNQDRPVIAVIPTNRTGIIINDDWDSFGQRQTDSGTVVFQDVLLKEEEILNFYEQEPESFFPTIRTHTAQTILVHVLLGIAEGAFEEAKNYTKNITRPWLTSKVDQATSDPYTIRQYGDLYVQLKAAAALAQDASNALQEAWDKERALTEKERGECGIIIATAKVATAKAALEVTSRMFEVMGARATLGKYRFDRFWRNVRTHTLHDPIEYKIRDIGEWALNGKLPEITPYS
ncbi:MULTISPECIES: acyl-CoA dehydrogenase family protein [Aeribacillus]|jgi:alkylation response protein AidB-like acyl-CoA dehydrogenase|uniref:Dibenzothiophene monooxygenase n=1 Tax=Aeribacillus composti TaxID=1868734 RepID=A0ABY9WDZ1_9BACI|nr:acyl-CoA dehydrogenase family protein [Aeribacillus composti]MED0702398.1 acyl-CoA dehydrogenase family protein [Aeribacillus composti]TVZ87617.1 dibenzothiophene monooxygenase [Aeribacillus composti]WNF33427.1 acyl-CoA dehydrogenase family protein [Aeribacillus composti]